MSKTLDFNTIKRNTLSVILNDENQTKVTLKLANKVTIEKVIEIYKHITDLTNATPEPLEDKDIMPFLYDACVTVLNRNRNFKTFTVEDIEKIWDFEDCVLFIQAYTEFIKEETNQKN